MVNLQLTRGLLYSAGETVLRLSNTGSVKPGDVLELRCPVAVNVEESAAFSLVEELRKTGDLSQSTDTLAASNGSTNIQLDAAKPLENNAVPLAEQEQLTLLPWQNEVDAISSKLNDIRSYKTFTVQVEAVLDNQNVQITPAWSDIPQGVEITKSRASQEVPDASFLQHLGLDWQVLIGEELVSYSEYKKRTVLQQKGMDLDEEGEIVVAGVRLRDTLPAAAYSIFLKGLESELADASVEVPHTNAIARPDKAKLEMQARYGGQVRSLVNELFMQRGLIKDGAHGRSLVERPCALLDLAIARVVEKGHEAKFANNSALLHSAAFGYIKEQTSRGWSEHSYEEQYQDAIKHARRFMLLLREQLQWRSWR